MPSSLVFRNIKKPIMGGGLPLLADERGKAFLNDDVFWITGFERKELLYSEWHPGATFSDLKKWVQDTFGDSEPEDSEYQSGTAYKRIAWPMIYGDMEDIVDQPKKTQSFVALRILLEKLSNIFQTIEPTEANLYAYGHVVRELLLLACMEVESSWAAVLRENGYRKENLKTSDYVKLHDPMLLSTYRIYLRSYPEFPSFSPFECWDALKATQSLPWYEAYNRTKHNREENLRDATLQLAVHAVGAAAVMFYAQFGCAFDHYLGDKPATLIEDIFDIRTDLSSYPGRFYLAELRLNPDTLEGPIASPDWNLIDYPF